MSYDPQEMAQAVIGSANHDEVDRIMAAMTQGVRQMDGLDKIRFGDMLFVAFNLLACELAKLRARDDSLSVDGTLEMSAHVLDAMVQSDQMIAFAENWWREEQARQAEMFVDAARRSMLSGGAE